MAAWPGPGALVDLIATHGYGDPAAVPALVVRGETDRPQYRAGGAVIARAIARFLERN
jgi:hypothetical protein